MTYVQIAVVFGLIGVAAIIPMLGILGTRLKGIEVLWIIPLAILVFLWGFAWPLSVFAMTVLFVIGVYYTFFPSGG